MGLKEFTKKLNEGNSIEFMSNRTKGELSEIIDVLLTITDFAFLKNDDGDYAVFIVKEIPDSFYFGGLVITENLKTLEDNGFKAEIQKDGLPCKITARKSKNKKTYYAIEFYPESDLPF